MLQKIFGYAGTVFRFSHGFIHRDIVCNGAEFLERLGQVRIGVLRAKDADFAIFDAAEFVQLFGDFFAGEFVRHGVHLEVH